MSKRVNNFLLFVLVQKYFYLQQAFAYAAKYTVASSLTGKKKKMSLNQFGGGGLHLCPLF